MRFLAILAAVPLAACGAGEVIQAESGTKIAAAGTGTARSFAVDGFNQVDLRGADDVDVRVGPTFMVRAEGPSDELDKLDIRRDGATLKVGRTGKNGFSWGGGSHSQVRIFVTLPSLTSAVVAGSGNMAIDQVPNGDFVASVAGSGNMTIGRLATTSTDISVAGSGDLTAAGQTGRLKVSVAGSGNLKAAELKASAADVSVAGSGDVRAAVTGAANVNLVGSGDVDLGSGAKCTTSKIGSGEVRCGG